MDPATVPPELYEAPLDRGERDVLALAGRLCDPLVLMDETAGRTEARARGLAVRGSLGILVESYRGTLITAEQLRLYFSQAAGRRDIWVNRALVERLAHEVLGSTPP